MGSDCADSPITILTQEDGITQRYATVTPETTIPTIVKIKFK